MLSCRPFYNLSATANTPQNQQRGVFLAAQRMPLSMSSTAALDIFKKTDAVCFDVDSTVCTEEGIDVLAAHCGAGEAVAEWTKK